MTKYHSMFDKIDKLIQREKVIASGQEYIGEKSKKAAEYGIGVSPVVASSQVSIANTRQYPTDEVKKALESNSECNE